MCTQLYLVPPPRTVASDHRCQYKLGTRGGYYQRHHIYKNHRKSTPGDQLCARVDRLSDTPYSRRADSAGDVEVAPGLQVPVTLIIIFSNRTRLAY